MQGAFRSQLENLPTFILVAPLTDFSKELAMAAGSNTGGPATACGQNGDWQSCRLLCRNRAAGSVFGSRIQELARGINLQYRIACGGSVCFAVSWCRELWCIRSVGPGQSLQMIGNGAITTTDHPPGLRVGSIIRDPRTWHHLHSGWTNILY
jgi:hypothetical protein